MFLLHFIAYYCVSLLLLLKIIKLRGLITLERLISFLNEFLWILIYENDFNSFVINLFTIKYSKKFVRVKLI